MATTTEDLNTRLDRLERDFRDFSSEVAASMRAGSHGEAALSRVSLLAWLQISGPTFATLVFGFTVLWNAQQVHTANMLEIQRSVGRLEGSISGLDVRIDKLDGRIDQLDAGIQKLDGRIDQLDAGIQKLDGRIDKLDGRIDKLANAIDALAKRLGSS